MRTPTGEIVLTSLGELIKKRGLSIPFIIEKSGINRNRLTNLRINPNANLSFNEARTLAPVLNMTLEELGSVLDELEEKYLSENPPRRLGSFLWQAGVDRIQYIN